MEAESSRRRRLCRKRGSAICFRLGPHRSQPSSGGNRFRRGMHDEYQFKRKVQTDLPSSIADCRLEAAQACVLIRIRDAGTDFGAICLRLGVLDHWALTRHPRGADYLPSCLLGCPDRFPVRCPEGYILRNSPKSLLRNSPGCLTGCCPSRGARCSDRCGLGCSFACGPRHSLRYSARRAPGRCPRCSPGRLADCRRNCSLSYSEKRQLRCRSPKT